MQRLQLIINGQVQGVGFRPTVYRVAQQLNLTGFVKNTGMGVLIKIQGLKTHDFTELLTSRLPSLARLDSLSSTSIALSVLEKNFVILNSDMGMSATIIGPDVTVCADCLTELFEPKSRYYRYPFLNCTQCGPRYSITHALPYDRAQTAMADFPLCHACSRDYHDPLNRRYHAQPTACSQCGPVLRVAINTIADDLRMGKIIALKGLGGYQFICDAKNAHAIARLRLKKARSAKPLALMCINVKSAQLWVNMDRNEEALLTSAARPIVLMEKKVTALPESVAPGLSSLGIMLASTPLHYLLFNALIGNVNGTAWLEETHSQVLIVTSANLHGNPLIADDTQALRECPWVAESIITYNRSIVARVDDSVVRIMAEKPFFIRRARGFVPTRILLAHAVPPTLALGGHLKNTLCLTRGAEAFVSAHIGNLNTKATIDFFHDTLEHLQRLLAVKPERIAHDCHPDSYSTRLANSFSLPQFAIQHHHAHLASVAAEHQLTGPMLGLALDGYGYGLDKNAWGGELFLLEKHTFQRLSHFLPIAQPGGETASREPWRMAASVWHHLGRGTEITTRFIAQAQALDVQTLLTKNLCFATSSCGRLFDAAAAILGLLTHSQYEGQGAMLLESLVTKPLVLANGWDFNDQTFNLLPTLAFISDKDPVVGANIFHGTLIAGLCDWLVYWAKLSQVKGILLSGGCLLNKVLAEGLVNGLRQAKLKVYVPRLLPANDGGISLGQAWLAGNR